VERRARLIRWELEEMQVGLRARAGDRTTSSLAAGPDGRGAGKEVSMIRRVPRSVLHGVLALALTAGAATALTTPAVARHHDNDGFYYYSGPRYYYAPPPAYYYP